MVLIRTGGSPAKAARFRVRQFVLTGVHDR